MRGVLCIHSRPKKELLLLLQSRRKLLNTVRAYIALVGLDLDRDKGSCRGVGCCGNVGRGRRHQSTYSATDVSFGNNVAIRKVSFDRHQQEHHHHHQPPPSPVSAVQGGGGTFVSKYYHFDLGEVESFLQRKNFSYRETTSHLIVRECPFCERPTYGKMDNLYKLYISRDGAAWFCHRCGTKGSWFDFKRRLGSGLLASLDPSLPSPAEHGALDDMPLPPPPLQIYNPSSSARSTDSGWIASVRTPQASAESSVEHRPPASSSAAAVTDATAAASRPSSSQTQAQTRTQYTGRKRGRSMSVVDDLREAQVRLMDDPASRHVKAWLTGNEPGQRGLKSTVLRKYGVGCATYSFANEHNQFQEAECVVFPWMQEVATQTGNKGQTDGRAEVQWRARRLKIRAMNEKAWQRIVPAGGGWGLFGLHTVAPDATEVVLTEGEFDAMAVYQATGRAAVSLPNGCRSLPVEVLPMLERFEKIYLWMDADPPGTEGAEKFARKLGVRRTFIVRPLAEHTADPPKDANDALLRGDVDLEQMLRCAQRLPDNRIVRFSDLKAMVLDEMRRFDKCEGARSKSFGRLMDLLKGFRKGEMTILSGPTGAGKTTFLSQLSVDLAAQGVNTLWGSFEVQNTRLMGKMLRQFHSAPLPLADVRGMEALAERFNQLPMLFMKFHGSTSLDEVMDAMEYSAYVHDTSLVILDNLQFMLSITNSGGTDHQKAYRGANDRFYQLDTAVERFRRFATEKNIHVMVVVHPRKEDDAQRLGLSSIFGTAKATQDADNVLILQRHAGLHYLDLKKNRYDGEIGVVPLEFERHTTRLKEGGRDQLEALKRALRGKQHDQTGMMYHAGAAKTLDDAYTDVQEAVA